jgi:hypothetical protein
LQADIGNASHRLPAYFEWWYFHFVTPEGEAINMVVHETDIFGLRDAPFLSLSFLMRGCPPQYVRRELSGSEIARGRHYLQVGAGLITETQDTIFFDIPFPGRGRFNGEMTRLAPALASAGHRRRNSVSRQVNWEKKPLDRSSSPRYLYWYPAN